MLRNIQPFVRPCHAPGPSPRSFPSWLPWVLLALLAPATPVAGQETSHWSVTPYLWATDTTVDLSFRDAAIGGDQVSFKDLLDTLDAAFMLHVEYGRGRWSAFGDLTYLETSDSEQRPVFFVESSSDQVFLDAAVGYWPSGVGTGFNVFGGLRYASFDDRYRFLLGDNQVTERRSDKDYTDALVGARYFLPLGERWQLMLRGDRSFGDTEGTWLIRAQLAWIVGERRQNRIVFGYELKEAEYQNGDLNLDYAFKGPTAGFNFRF